MTPAPASRFTGDIAGYRTFIAIVTVNYFTLLVLTPKAWGEAPVPVGPLVALSLAYLVLGIWGFEVAHRVRRIPLSLAYLLLEFWIGMTINGMVHGFLLPLILLPLAAQAVALLPRPLAVLMCLLVIVGVSGNLTWVPSWPDWFRNLASATAAVVFVVVYVGVAAREREARHRVEALSAEVAQLAAAEERNRLAREIHDTLGHYLTVIHVHLEAARALVRTEPERALQGINRAQTLAHDGLTAVRQSVKALREDSTVDGTVDQIRSLATASREEGLEVDFQVSGEPRPLRAGVALALHRTALEALTNVRRHAGASRVGIDLVFLPGDRVRLCVRDDGKGAANLEGGFGLTGIRERATQLSGSVDIESTPGQGFELRMELPG